MPQRIDAASQLRSRQRCGRYHWSVPTLCNTIASLVHADSHAGVVLQDLCCVANAHRIDWRCSNVQDCAGQSGISIFRSSHLLTICFHPLRKIQIVIALLSFR